MILSVQSLIYHACYLRYNLFTLLNMGALALMLRLAELLNELLVSFKGFLYAVDFGLAWGHPVIQLIDITGLFTDFPLELVLSQR